MEDPLYRLPAALRINETSNYSKDLQTAKRASKVMLRRCVQGNECLKRATERLTARWPAFPTLRTPAGGRRLAALGHK
jgi:hypothetical protein